MDDALFNLRNCYSLLPNSYIELAEQYAPGFANAVKDLVKLPYKHSDKDMRDGVKYIAHIQTGVMGGEWRCSICGPNYCELNNNSHNKDDQRTQNREMTDEKGLPMTYWGGNPTKTSDD